MALPKLVPDCCNDCTCFSTEKERESWELPTEYDVPVCGLDDDHGTVSERIEDWENDAPPEDCPRRNPKMQLLLHHFYEQGIEDRKCEE